jgi:hypothetical protein
MYHGWSGVKTRAPAQATKNGFDFLQERSGGSASSLTITDTALSFQTSVLIVLGALTWKSLLDIPADAK